MKTNQMLQIQAALAAGLLGISLPAPSQDLRSAVLPSSCVVNILRQPSSGFFGWSLPLGSTQHSSWQDVMEIEDGQFLFDAERFSLDTAKFAGAYVKKSCTQFAAYPDSWKLVEGTASDITFAINNVFQKKGARILDLDVKQNPIWLPGQSVDPYFYAILVPNYGAVSKSWWWGYGATAQDLTKVINGQAWASFPNDGIKKRLVDIELQPNGLFSFVLNRWGPGESWWWGYGASAADITKLINGQAWANFRADGIPKRLVDLEVQPDGRFAFILTKWEPGVAWWWFTSSSAASIHAFAKQNNARVIDIEQNGLSSDRYAVILLKNK